MASKPVARLDVERYRGVLSTDLCASQQQAILRLLADCEAQLAAVDRNVSSLRAPYKSDAPTEESPTSPDIGIEQQAERALLERRVAELQEGLRHLDRLTELGQVVSALLHELVQPLSAINNYVAACEHLLSCGEYGRVKNGLHQASTQTVRAREIVRRVRGFFK